MVIYNFYLKIKGSQERYNYSLDFKPNQENNPEQVFTTEIKESLRRTLQKQSSCAIKDKDLNKILNTWIQDIKEGYRESTLTLDLPLLIESEIEKLQESGNQQLPEIIEPDIAEIEPQIGALPPLAFSADS
ncbi:MAG: hypothetical protein QNJ32_02275 [Xenococcaceae cyanobacterium MO_167.B27]|nr:hypothetical protein [Xenococcaceae cyanobacterium MO_167.B27]